MLVLTRKLGELVRIGEEITVKIVKVQGGAVRLGIEAPQEFAITRHEPETANDENNPNPNKAA